MHEAAAERIAAEACHQLDRLDDACRHIERALFLCEVRDVGAETARTLLVKGFVEYAIALRDRNDLLRATECYTAAMHASADCRDYMGQISAKIGLGLCALAEERTIDAREIWFGPLVDVIQKSEDDDAQAAIGLGLARAYQQSGLSDLAEPAYERVLNLTEFSPLWLRAWRIPALTGLGAVWWHRGERDRAERIWQQAIDLGRNVPYQLRMTKINIARTRVDARAAPW